MDAFYKPNPLIYPCGLVAGFNPQHPAVKGVVRFSGIGSGGGGGFTSLIPGGRGVISGTAPTSGIDSIVGPVWKPSSPGSTSAVAWAYTGSFGDLPVTMAIIFTQTAAPSALSVLFGNGNPSGSTGCGIQQSATGVMQLYRQNISVDSFSNFTARNGDSYFFAMSQIAGGAAMHGVFARLQSGSVQQQIVGLAGGGQVAPVNQNWSVGYPGFSLAPPCSIAAVMYGAYELDISRLMQWAADPWSFWYPQEENWIGVTATTMWVNAVITNGGSVSADRQTLVDNLIITLKAKGVWPILDRLWLLAGENEPSALTDIVAAQLATKVGTPPFVIDRGYTGDGISTPTNYINTNYNPVVNGVNYSLNAAHISVWCNDNNVCTSGADRLLGLCDESIPKETLIGFSLTDTAVRGRINESPNSPQQGAVNTKIGHWLVNRSGAAASQLYQNAALWSQPNGTAAASLVNGNFFILCANDIGTAQPFAGSAHQTPMFSIGGNLSAANVADFHDTLRTYMAAVGVPTLSYYLSPDADSVDGGWTNETGGTTLYPSIDEHLIANDADYIRSSNNPSNDVCRVSLGNPSVAVAQPFEISYRYGKSGTARIDITVTLKQGSTTIASWTHTDVPP